MFYIYEVVKRVDEFFLSDMEYLMCFFFRTSYNKLISAHNYINF